MTALHVRSMPPAAAAGRRGGRAAATATAPRLLAVPPRTTSTRTAAACSMGVMGLSTAPPHRTAAGAPRWQPAPVKRRGWIPVVAACGPESSPSGEPPEVQAQKQGPRNVSVTLMTGATGNKMQLQLPATATIRDLKNDLRQRTGLEPEQQKLLFGAHSARPDTTTLGSLSAAELAEVVLVTRLQGG